MIFLILQSIYKTQTPGKKIYTKLKDMIIWCCFCDNEEPIQHLFLLCPFVATVVSM